MKIVPDIETTDININDEIPQPSIIDYDTGTVLMDDTASTTHILDPLSSLHN